MLFHEEVGSESRRVSLPAELLAEPSPGAGGQLEVLVLQGSCEGPVQKQATPHAPRIFLSFRLERDELHFCCIQEPVTRVIRCTSVPRGQRSVLLSPAKTPCSPTPHPSPSSAPALTSPADQYDWTSNHDIGNTISPLKITPEKY